MIIHRNIDALSRFKLEVALNIKICTLYIFLYYILYVSKMFSFMLIFFNVILYIYEHDLNTPNRDKASIFGLESICKCKTINEEYSILNP